MGSDWRLIKRKLGTIVVLMMFMTMLSAPAFAAPLSDISSHWAKAQIENCIEQGLVGGYPDGTFRPEKPISRAEFIVMTNKAFGFTDITSIEYSDVSASDWFAADIARAKAAGYIAGYEDGAMRPNAQLSRQEVACIISRILALDTEAVDTNSILQRFSDGHLFADWSRNSIAAMITKGYLNGYPDNTFKPANSIKRAEAVVVLNAVYGKKPDAGEVALPEAQSQYKEPGTYGPQTGTQTINEDVTISASGVILNNTTIKGDLTITEAVANGDVELKNVKVEGTSYINGGGPNSITLDQCVLNEVIVNKKDGKIRIVLSEDSSIKTMVAASGLKLVGQGTITGLTINSAGVEVEPNPINQPLVKSGITAQVGGATVSGSSSGGGGGGGSSIVTTANVGTAAELNSALNDSNITSITFTNNITAVATVSRSLTMNFSSYTLTGNLMFSHNGTGTSVLTGGAGPRIIGHLTVNTPNASFNNGVQVNGAVNIGNVAPASWTETADGNILTITDPDGATITVTGSPGSVTVTQDAGGNLTLTVNPGATVSSITTNAPVNIQVAAGATVTEITAEPGANGTSITNNGTTGTLTVNAPITLVANVAPENTTVGASGSMDVSGAESGNVPVVAVTGISVSPVSMTLTVGGATGKITATVSPENATNKKVTWTSSDTAVATVANGVVTPLAAGSATITATTVDGNRTGICTVTVANPTEAELQIIIADEQGIWVCVLDKASDEPILGLVKEYFVLKDASGNDVAFKFNDPELRDPDIPAHEYFISPAEGQFSRGTYTLAFSKTGYQSASEEIIIGAPAISQVSLPSGLYTAGVEHTIPVTVNTSGVDDNTQAMVTLVGESFDIIIVGPVSGNIINNTATIEITVPSTLAIGTYYIKAEVADMYDYQTIALEKAVNMNNLGANPNGLLISIFAVVGEEEQPITDLTIQDFMLIKDFGQQWQTVVTGISLDQDPLAGQYEYEIQPPMGEVFADGIYRLAFNKSGYQSQHVNFQIGTPPPTLYVGYVSPDVVVAGAQTAVNVPIGSTNIASGSTVTVKLYADVTGTIEVGTAATATISAEGTATVSFVVPNTAVAGKYYFVASVDETTSNPTMLVVGPDPDKSTVSATTSPPSPMVDEAFTFQVNVRDAANNPISGLEDDFAQMIYIEGSGLLSIDAVSEDGTTGNYTVTAAYNTAETININVGVLYTLVGTISDVVFQ